MQSERMTSEQQPNIKVYIIHGYGAGPQSHWFQWLKQQLEAQGIICLLYTSPSPRDS